MAEYMSKMRDIGDKLVRGAEAVAYVTLTALVGGCASSQPQSQFGKYESAELNVGKEEFPAPMKDYKFSSTKVALKALKDFEIKRKFGEYGGEADADGYDAQLKQFLDDCDRADGRRDKRISEQSLIQVNFR
jgi:hypothetical protein